MASHPTSSANTFVETDTLIFLVYTKQVKLADCPGRDKPGQATLGQLTPGTGHKRPLRRDGTGHSKPIRREETVPVTQGQ